MKDKTEKDNKPKNDKFVKEKLDIRIKHLIDNGVKHGHRTLFVLAGPKAKEQVVILHHILHKSRKSPSDNAMLWCYESKDFVIPRFHKKRKKMMEWNQSSNVSGRDEFNLFLASTKIRFCYYREVSNIMGNTFETLVLQDFESLTPNILGQTVETVQGGGLVIFLLESQESLKTLRYAVNFEMDNMEDFSTDQLRPRFNQRLLKSLSICNMAMMITDELLILDDVLKMTILPHVLNLGPTEDALEENFKSEKHELLVQLQESYTDRVMKSLVMSCKTFDQASVVVKLAETIMERASHKTFTVTAARGRGKSAAMGLAIAFAIKKNYSNILVTSPSPENLVTFFQFVVKGLEAFGYKNKKDFLIEKSTDIKVNKSVIKIEVVKKHKQVVEYIHPSDCSKLTFAEILVIDEAAAIPLSYIKNLMGPYMTFMSSTLHGYEGTGQTLARKFFKDLKEGNVLAQRTLEGLQLNETIRYKSADPVESWLNRLLILNSATKKLPPSIRDSLAAKDCSLYHIDRESLFQFKKKAEKLLAEFVAVYTASNYKHSPDDLKIMSDSSGHQLFCLLSPPSDNGLDQRILCVLHVCYEGKLVKEYLSSELRYGKISKNNTISYQIASEFRQYNINLNDVAALRVVHIATHPDLHSKGFGNHALSLLEDYFRNSSTENLPSKNRLLRDTSKNPSSVAIEYLNAQFDLTQHLLCFWQKGGFVPLVVGHATDDLTGDNTCIVVKSISKPLKWISVFWSCFYKGMLNLLPGIFNTLHPKLAYRLLLRSFDIHQPPTQEFLRTMYGKAIWEVVSIHSASPLHIDCLKPTLKMLAMAFFEVLNKDLLSEEESLVLIALALQNKSIKVTMEELKMTLPEVEKHFSEAYKKIKKSLMDSSMEVISSSKQLEHPSCVKQPSTISQLGDMPSLKKISKMNFASEITSLFETCISSGQRGLVLIQGTSSPSKLPLLIKYFEHMSKKPLKVLYGSFTSPELCLQSYPQSSGPSDEDCDVLVVSNLEKMMPSQLAKCNELLKSSGLLILQGDNIEEKMADLSLCSRRFYTLLPSLKNKLSLSSNLKVLSHSLQDGAKPYSYPGNAEFETLKESFQDIEALHGLMQCTRNLEQAQGLKTAVNILLDKLTSSLIHIQGGKGHGKSALLGFTIAYAAYYSFSNIFVTAPRLQDLRTFFHYLLRGLEAVGFEKDKDFKAMRDDTEIVRVEVMKSNRIIIQYIHPEDTSKIGMTELMVIEEATSLPLPTLNSLLGDYMTIMTSSTEGSGCPGLLRHMELYNVLNDQIKADAPYPKLQGRKTMDITLAHSVTAQPNDGLKIWLSKLLLLKMENVTPEFLLPHYCTLYKLNKNVLFNGSPESEQLLQRVMTLYRAGDYQIDTNDISTLADLPEHQLFCLLPTLTGESIPEPLALVHVYLGDLPPALQNTQCHFRHQFREVASLPKVWILKVASTPNFQHSGYGRRAIQYLEDFYNRDLTGRPEEANKDYLLHRLDQISPESAHFIGAAFNLNLVLLRFFIRSGYKPTYLAEEHGQFSTTYPFMMIKKLREGDSSQFAQLHADFQNTFISQLSSLKGLSSFLALEILEAVTCHDNKLALNLETLLSWLSVDDLDCLEINIVAQLANYSVVSKYFPILARLYFQYQIGRAVLYKEQKAILLGIGLQFKSIDEMITETKLKQARALLNRLLRCLTTNLRRVLEDEVDKTIQEPELQPDVLEQVEKDLLLAKYAKYTIPYTKSQWSKVISSTGFKDIISFKRKSTSTNDSQPPKKKKKRN